MKIFVDENIPAMTVGELREGGHDVVDIRGTDDEGLIDEDVWDMAQKQQRLLITTDKGFALNRHEKHYGILIVKLKQPNRLKIHRKVITAMDRFKAEEWLGMTIIMQDMIYSIRKGKKG